MPENARSNREIQRLKQMLDTQTNPAQNTEISNDALAEAAGQEAARQPGGQWKAG